MNREFSIFKLPTKAWLILHLLREETKSRAFILGFEKAGLTSNYDGTNLVPLIFSLLDFPEPTDELMNWYVERLDHYAEDIDLEDSDIISESAFSLYIDFEIKRRSIKS